MDPSQIKLTTTQKIVPLLKAINKEIPFSFLLVLGIAITAWVYFPTLLPVFIADNTIVDFLLRRVIVGFIIGFATFWITALIGVFVEEKCIPLFKKIREHYEKEALETKKKVLEDAEVEMLQK